MKQEEPAKPISAAPSKSCTEAAEKAGKATDLVSLDDTQLEQEANNEANLAAAEVSDKGAREVVGVISNSPKASELQKDLQGEKLPGEESYEDKKKVACDTQAGAYT